MGGKTIPLKEYYGKGCMNRVKLLRILYKNLDSQMERDILSLLAEEEKREK